MGGLSAFVKTYLVPGSLPVLLLGVTAGIILLYARKPADRWGRRLLVGICVLYWILGMPGTGRLLERGLIGDSAPILRASDAAGATAVVVLTGGVATYRSGDAQMTMLTSATAFRTLEARRLYRLLGDPWVVVSGGTPSGRGTPEAEAVRGELVMLGIPAERILVDAQSRNTREHAIYLPPLLQRHRIEQFVLVTSATEVRRQKAALEAAGLKPLASVPADESGGEARFLPSTAGLASSRAAIMGYMGLLYYWWNGWL